MKTTQPSNTSRLNRETLPYLGEPRQTAEACVKVGHYRSFKARLEKCSRCLQAHWKNPLEMPVGDKKLSFIMHYNFRQ